MKDLNIIEAQLQRTLGFFPRVDTKVSGLFAVNSTALTLMALNVEAGDLRLWYISLPAGLGIALLIFSYYFLYRANFPNLKGGEGSVVYFSEIKKFTEQNYVASYLETSEEDYRKDMLGQVWRNSVILCQKYEWVAHATRCTLASFIPIVWFLVATAITHSRVPQLGG